MELRCYDLPRPGCQALKRPRLTRIPREGAYQLAWARHVPFVGDGEATSTWRYCVLHVWLPVCLCGCSSDGRVRAFETSRSWRLAGRIGCVSAFMRQLTGLICTWADGCPGLTPLFAVGRSAESQVCCYRKWLHGEQSAWNHASNSMYQYAVYRPGQASNFEDPARTCIARSVLLQHRAPVLGFNTNMVVGMLYIITARTTSLLGIPGGLVSKYFSRAGNLVAFEIMCMGHNNRGN